MNPEEQRQAEQEQAIARGLAARLRQTRTTPAATDAVMREIGQRLLQLPWPRWLTYVEEFFRADVPDAAMGLLHEAQRRWPGEVDLLYWLGNGYRMIGDLPEAEKIFHAVLAARPTHEHAMLSLVYMLRDAGRVDAAANVIQAWAARNTGDHDTVRRCGEFLAESRRFALGLEMYESAIARGATDPVLYFEAGNTAIVLGQFEHGRRRLQEAIDRGLDLNDYHGIWLRFAAAQKYDRSDHPDLQRFRDVMADASRSGISRAAAGFALGKALGDLEDYRGAVEALRPANAIERARRPWRVDTWQELVAHRLRSAALAPLPPLKDEPTLVFIIGLPRSGTTLLAERLGRHPDVVNRDETNWIPFVASHLLGPTPPDAGALESARRVVLAHIVQDDAPARWYVDKNPLNFRFLDFVAAMFPTAKILHCVRDRRDVAFSIWSLMFAHADLEFSTDFANIRTFTDGYDRIMEHWKKVLPLPIYTVDYETLVERPAETLRAIGEFVGMPPEDLERLQPKDRTGVGTPSVWQVRQPVYKKAVARWKSYAPFLPELLEHFPDDGKS